MEPTADEEYDFVIYPIPEGDSLEVSRKSLQDASAVFRSYLLKSET